MKISKILWLSPNLNHYKTRFLNHLSQENDIELTVLSGIGRIGKGDEELLEDWEFNHVRLQVLKRDFGKSSIVKSKLKSCIRDFDWIMLPTEKKNLPLFLYVLKLKKKHKNFRLFSYNHPVLKSNKGKVTILDRLLTKYYYKKLDRVVFYTEQSCKFAIEEKLIVPKKAFWANNTIDTQEVTKNYKFQLPPKEENRILFIGRLIASKRIEDLFVYYSKLAEKLPNLKLDIIGDGPKKAIVKDAVKNDKNITWYGTLVEEHEIAPIISKASFVFIPGHSGLSINHAFAYGRPYITLKGPSHAPEISYIENGVNGYILDNSLDENINILYKLFSDKNLLKAFCENANKKGSYLSVNHWIVQIKSALLHE